MSNFVIAYEFNNRLEGVLLNKTRFANKAYAICIANVNKAFFLYEQSRYLLIVKFCSKNGKLDTGRWAGCRIYYPSFPTISNIHDAAFIFAIFLIHGYL